MSAPHALVLTAPGTNRHPDVMFALRQAGATTSALNMHQLRDQPNAINNAQMVVVAGGFSFADALGAGRLFALELSEIVGSAIQVAAQAGKPVIGICNGFQTLVRLGVLPGKHRAALGHNEVGGFQCSWISMKPTSKRSVWTQNLTEEIYCPIAHGEGRVMTRNEKATQRLWNNGQVALSYVDADGNEVGYPLNPNGSVSGIAALNNHDGNVMGLMPHPEDHIFPWQHPHYHRGATGNSGLVLFQNGIRYA